MISFWEEHFFKNPRKKNPMGRVGKMTVEKKRGLTPTNQRLQRVSRLINDKKKIPDD